MLSGIRLAPRLSETVGASGKEQGKVENQGKHLHKSNVRAARSET
jgi:hypothetical protein